MRTEHDFLGEMNVPDNVYYGVQTMRAMENFHITGEHLDPDFIQPWPLSKKQLLSPTWKRDGSTRKSAMPWYRLPVKSSTASGWTSSLLIRSRRCRYFRKYEYERSIVQPGLRNHRQRKRPLRHHLAEQPRQHGSVDERRLPDEHQSLPEHERQEADRSTEGTGNGTGCQSR